MRYCRYIFTMPSSVEVMAMTKTNIVSAVFFDLFETLITEYMETRLTHDAVAARLGIDASLFHAVWRAHRERRMQGFYPEFAEVLRNICRAIGHHIDEPVIKQLDSEWSASKKLPLVHVDDRLLCMLALLRAMDVKIGVISNCAPEEVSAWTLSPLQQYVDDIVFSFQVAVTKPNPRIYEIACDRLGVKPKQSLFIGDGGDGELSGAAEVGMSPYWATWFLDLWPQWKRSELERRESSQYQRLQTPSEVLAIVHLSMPRES